MPSHEEIKAGVESPRNLGKGGPETMGSLKDMMDKVGQQFGGARRGGAMTRKMRRKASLSRRRSYRRRVKSSPCRKKGPAVCRSMKNCKFVSKKRRYCRKSKNTRRRRRSSSEEVKDVVLVTVVPVVEVLAAEELVVEVLVVNYLNKLFINNIINNL